MASQPKTCAGCDKPLGAPSIRILLLLASDLAADCGLPVSAVCGESESSWGTAMRHINTLTAAGMIERAPDNADGRRVRLSITGKGLLALSQAQRGPDPQPNTPATADPFYPVRALKAAAQAAGASPDQLLRHWKRPPEVVTSRFALMHSLSRRGMGVTAIGRKMKRDHSTVRYGLARAEYLLGRDPAFVELCTKLASA